MEDESSVTRSIIDELNSWDTQRDQMHEEGSVTGSVIDDIDS